MSNWQQIMAFAAAIPHQGRDALRAYGQAMIRAITSLVIALSCLGSAMADDSSAEYRLLETAAHIFWLKYVSHAYDSKIQLKENANPPWSEARIINKEDDFFVHRDDKDPCRFDLGGFILSKDGVASMGRRFASIKFDKLSDETETTHVPECGMGMCDSYYDLVVLGLPGAVCDIVQDKKAGTCYDQLKLHRLSLDEIRKTRRALRFVFANVCSPVELPF